MLDRLPHELLLCVLDFIFSRADVLSFSLACLNVWRATHKTVFRHLHCPLREDDPQCDSLVRTFSPTIPGDPLLSHKDTVCSVVQRITIFTDLFTPCLYRLTPWMFVEEPCVLELPTLRRILSVFPHVRTVDLASLALSASSSSRTARQQARAFIGTHIRTLHMHTVLFHKNAEYPFMRFMEALPNLTYVHLQSYSSVVTPRITPRDRANPPFRRLALDLSRPPCSFTTRLSPSLMLIPRYENLTELQVWSIHPPDVPSLRRLLLASGNTLEVLSLAFIDGRYRELPFLDLVTATKYFTVDKDKRARKHLSPTVTVVAHL